MHNFKLGDKVRHESDSDFFEVVGIRKETVEIKGDFSGGTHNVSQSSWVDVSEIEDYFTRLHHSKNGESQPCLKEPTNRLD